MNNTDELYEAAKELLETRFKKDEPWVGAAAIKTNTGRIITSVGFHCIPNNSAMLCHETGAICECFKLNEQITRFLCISRNDKGQYEVLPPCGICQERLYYWGPNVKIAVPKLPETKIWHYVELQVLHPHYWFKPYMDQA